MTKSQIIKIIGEDIFKKACTDLQIAASDPNYGSHVSAAQLPDTNLPHKITDLIWNGDEPLVAKINLLFEIYDVMPAYAHLMYATFHYDSFSTSDRRFWWQMTTDRLATGSCAIAQPIQYSLWCDFFEDPKMVSEAWENLTHPSVPDAALRRVLKVSGPVPFSKKRALYKRLIEDQKWHKSIVDSLYGSVVDVYGDIDRKDARRWLARLKLCDDERISTIMTLLDRKK